MCESKLRWPLKTKMDTSVDWRIIKQKFNMKGNRLLASVQQDNESWTDIRLEKNCEKMMKQVCEIADAKDNWGFLYRLVIDLPKRKKR